jgi:hypothetical protein
MAFAIVWPVPQSAEADRFCDYRLVAQVVSRYYFLVPF